MAVWIRYNWYIIAPNIRGLIIIYQSYECHLYLFTAWLHLQMSCKTGPCPNQTREKGRRYWTTLTRSTKMRRRNKLNSACFNESAYFDTRIIPIPHRRRPILCWLIAMPTLPDFYNCGNKSNIQVRMLQTLTPYRSLLNSPTTVVVHFSSGYLFHDAFWDKHQHFKKVREWSSHKALVFAGEDEEGVQEA